MSNALRISHGAFGRIALLEMDRHLVRHAHPHCHVLLKVGGEDTHFAVGDRTVPLTNEAAVLVNAWQAHAYVHTPGPSRTLILALYVEPAWLECIDPNWAVGGAPGFFNRPSGGVTADIQKRARELAEAMLHQPAWTPAHEHQLAGLMASVIERFTDWRDTGAPGGERRRGPSVFWRVRRAITVIEQELAARPKVETLVRASGLSRAHFFRTFDGSVGATPHVFLNGVRVERAIRALLHTNDDCATISRSLGFCKPAHFSRFFRDHASVPPTHFREVGQLRTIH